MNSRPSKILFQSVVAISLLLGLYVLGVFMLGVKKDTTSVPNQELKID